VPTKLYSIHFQYAGDVIPNLGRAMNPVTFASYFANLAPMIFKKTRNNCTPAEKSFGVGSMAECMESLDGQLVSIYNLYDTLARCYKTFSVRILRKFGVR